MCSKHDEEPSYARKFSEKSVQKCPRQGCPSRHKELRVGIYFEESRWWEATNVSTAQLAGYEGPP